MSGLSSYCRVCGKTHTDPKNYGLDHCPACETINLAAQKALKEANPDASTSDLLYAGRQAMQSGAHSARRTWINPRDFRREEMGR